MFDFDSQDFFFFVPYYFTLVVLGERKSELGSFPTSLTCTLQHTSIDSLPDIYTNSKQRADERELLNTRSSVQEEALLW